MRLYNGLVLVTYEAIIGQKKRTPSSEYVEWKLDAIRRDVFAGFDADDYLDVLEASFCADADEDIESLCDERTSYEEAVRQRAYDAFAGDVFHWFLHEGHRSAIPDFYNYDYMLKTAAAWAEERAENGRTDKSAQELLEDEISAIVRHKGPQKLRWFAKRTSAAVETAWLETGEDEAELDREREEMEALVDAVLTDAMECLDP